MEKFDLRKARGILLPMLNAVFDGEIKADIRINEDARSLIVYAPVGAPPDKQLGFSLNDEHIVAFGYEHFPQIACGLRETLESPVMQGG